MERISITETELWAYISKTADTKTIEHVEKWIDSPDYDKDFFTQVKTIFEHTLSDQSLSVEMAKDRFFDTVKPKSRTFKDLYKYVAILVIAVMGTYAYRYVSDNYVPIVVQTTYGEQKQINLSDGSSVWLNASSTLSYAKKHPRTLNLEGEAFFEVAKDKEYPFTVTTPDDITVKALGTSFNVKSYANSAVTETKLITGIVEVTNHKFLKNKTILNPYEKAVFDRSLHKMVKSKIKGSRKSIDWRNGKIQFKNKVFKDIALDLKNQFNIKLNFANSQIANSKFTGSFSNKTPINEILEVLKLSRNFNYKLNKETNEWTIE